MEVLCDVTNPLFGPNGAAWIYGRQKGGSDPVLAELDDGLQHLASLVKKVFPLSPKGMIDHLQLRRPIFRKSSTYGHFGREDVDFTWERVNAIDELRAKTA